VRPATHGHGGWPVGITATVRQAAAGYRWTVRGVLFVALAVGAFGLLSRLGELAHDAAALRHARPPS